MSAFLDEEGIAHDRSSKASGLLMSAVGGSQMTPSIGLVDLVGGDALLLCTDGLTKHVPDERITAMLMEPGSATSACDALVAAALDAGGTDNVTAIVARMQSQETAAH
jgi:protein phosphatase